MVFCDNSGADLDDIRRACRSTMGRRPVEVLGFEGNDRPEGMHYGYAELGTLDYVLDHSDLIDGARHFAKVTGQPCTPAVAREALGDLLRHTVRAVTLADVDAAVCAALRIAAGTLQSKSRSWAVSHPRMLAIFLSRKLTAATYGEIAKHFGVKQHSTAVAGEKKVRQWVAAKETLSLGDRKWAVKDLLDRVERDLQK